MNDSVSLKSAMLMVVYGKRLERISAIAKNVERLTLLAMTCAFIGCIPIFDQALRNTDTALYAYDLLIAAFVAYNASLVLEMSTARWRDHVYCRIRIVSDLSGDDGEIDLQQERDIAQRLNDFTQSTSGSGIAWLLRRLQGDPTAGMRSIISGLEREALLFHYGNNETWKLTPLGISLGLRFRARQHERTQSLTQI